MKQLKVKITGISPLLMHNGRGANPLDPLTRAHSALTKKRGKTESDHEAIARSEWEVSLYHDKEMGPYLSAAALDGCLKASAKSSKLGKTFGQSVMVVEDMVPIEYSGPRDLDGLFKAGFHDVRGVVIGKARVMRCRPKFNKWAASFTVAFDEQEVNHDAVERVILAAGKKAGIGDYRPEKGGRYGKFSAEVA